MPLRNLPDLGGWLWDDTPLDPGEGRVRPGKERKEAQVLALGLHDCFPDLIYTRYSWCYFQTRLPEI